MTKIKWCYKSFPYENDKPLVPIEECCKQICTMLHDTISDMHKEIENIEIERKSNIARRGSKIRMEELRDKMDLLRDMRYTLTEENICRCLENYPERHKKCL